MKRILCVILVLGLLIHGAVSHNLHPYGNLGVSLFEDIGAIPVADRIGGGEAEKLFASLDQKVDDHREQPYLSPFEDLGASVKIWEGDVKYLNKPKHMKACVMKCGLNAKCMADCIEDRIKESQCRKECTPWPFMPTCSRFCRTYLKWKGGK
ncbi:uncharacterized protein LOC135500032 [Lineus longissimus]|uniref:uncharacterized protein LOC135500032 n=1 Tax=Lineus longissimus TaxID=88925 RepID=UPI002B4F2A9E